MTPKIIEATNHPNGINWGKFLVARFDQNEWTKRSDISKTPLLRSLGWSEEHLWVLDLQTGEGALFWPGGSAHHDLNKHQIWVCPLFEPFLTWLYQQDLTDLNKLPDIVVLRDAPSALAGYRRPGPGKVG